MTSEVYCAGSAMPFPVIASGIALVFLTSCKVVLGMRRWRRSQTDDPDPVVEGAPTREHLLVEALRSDVLGRVLGSATEAPTPI
jgi:hypothetical protein